MGILDRVMPIDGDTSLDVAKPKCQTMQDILRNNATIAFPTGTTSLRFGHQQPCLVSIHGGHDVLIQRNIEQASKQATLRQACEDLRPPPMVADAGGFAVFCASD